MLVNILECIAMTLSPTESQIHTWPLEMDGMEFNL